MDLGKIKENHKSLLETILEIQETKLVTMISIDEIENDEILTHMNPSEWKSFSNEIFCYSAYLSITKETSIENVLYGGVEEKIPIIIKEIFKSYDMKEGITKIISKQLVDEFVLGRDDYDLRDKLPINYIKFLYENDLVK